MMINIGSKRISKSELTNVRHIDIQPNAVDLRLDKVFYITANEFLIDEERKVDRGSVEVKVDDDGYYRLEPGQDRKSVV